MRQRYKDGADWIKITPTGGVLSVAKSGQNPQFTEEELRAIVDTAADYGMRVAAHAHGTEGMKRAVIAGVASDQSSRRRLRKADIIAVPGNPLDDIRMMEDVTFVMKGGRIYKQL